MCNSQIYAEKVRTLNDLLRTTLHPNCGRVVLTQGVNSLGQEKVSEILQAVREFTEFTQDNDPHMEHDFGAPVVDGQKIFWKIDYYDKALKHGSEDPSNPEITTRVLTIMLPEEY